MALTLVLGGARSGKSAFAVEFGRRQDGPVSYIATAPESDVDMSERIERHRRERPACWYTIEEQFDLQTALDAAGRSLVIIDCLTLWTSNMMHRGQTAEEIRDISAVTAGRAATREATTIVISNEVGMGIHPATDVGREYRDILGWVNQTWAAAADRCLLMMAGKAIALNDPFDLIGRPGDTASRIRRS